MNEIVNKCLLTEDKFMPQIHLNQPEFTYSACGPSTKNKEIITSTVYKFFDKKSTSSGIKSMSNQQLADELHKRIIRKF